MNLSYDIWFIFFSKKKNNNWSFNCAYQAETWRWVPIRFDNQPTDMHILEKPNPLALVHIYDVESVETMLLFILKFNVNTQIVREKKRGTLSAAQICETNFVLMDSLVSVKMLFLFEIDQST